MIKKIKTAIKKAADWVVAQYDKLSSK